MSFDKFERASVRNLVPHNLGRTSGLGSGEACAAFILSQKHEGWAVLPALYDDGGFSGGTMERPTLKRLIADIEAGQIDVVVVYKVDRLTRKRRS